MPEGFYMLTETVEQIEKKILNALKDELNSKLVKTLEPIRQRMKSLTYKFLKDTPEYRALINGPLYGEFGFWAGTAEPKVERLLDIASDQVKVEHVKITSISREAFTGGIRIYIMPSDFKELLSSQDADIVTEKGIVLSWLEWLITRGDRIIIEDYLFSPSKNHPRSRSGDGLMHRTKKPRKFWRVPPEYAGTIRNNWFTRALRDMSEIFAQYTETIINEEINRVLIHE